MAEQESGIANQEIATEEAPKEDTELLDSLSAPESWELGIAEDAIDPITISDS